MGNKIDMTGWIMKEHNVPESRITVLSEDKEYKIKNNKTRGTYWKCQCECGNIFTSEGCSLRKGERLSCGCKRFEEHRAKLTGKRFGHLLVLNMDRIDGHNCIWKCQCDCGNITYVTSYSLQKGHTKSCGCASLEGLKKYTQSLIKDLTGQRFGKLIVLKYLYTNNCNHRVYLCQCDCGNTCEIVGPSLTNHLTESCGCLGRSRGENKIKNILEKNHIKFETQKKYVNLISPKGRQLRYDFFINENFLLEFDGMFHFQPDKGWNTQEKVEKTQEYDQIKNEYAKSHNIPLKRIPYWDYDKITLENIMSDKWLINN